MTYNIPNRKGRIAYQKQQTACTAKRYRMATFNEVAFCKLWLCQANASYFCETQIVCLNHLNHDFYFTMENS
jgi:hypothetical protein